jgi:hypothetical protein
MCTQLENDGQENSCGPKGLILVTLFLLEAGTFWGDGVCGLGVSKSVSPQSASPGDAGVN